MDRWKMVFAAMVAVAVGILLNVGTAHAGGTPTRIPNPGTLLLLTTGFGALAWWTRARR
jgi:hypothetical protein